MGQTIAECSQFILREATLDKAYAFILALAILAVLYRGVNKIADRMTDLQVAVTATLQGNRSIQEEIRGILSDQTGILQRLIGRKPALRKDSADGDQDNV